VPLGAVAFFLGGIGITDLLRSGALLIVVAVSIAAMGLGISSLTRKTTGSIVLTYGLVLALVGGTPLLAIVEVVFKSTRGQQINTPVVLYLNPFFGLADAVNATRASGMGMSGLPSPLGVIAEALPGSPAMGGPDQVGPGMFVEEAVGFEQTMTVEAVPMPVEAPVAVEVPAVAPEEAGEESGLGAAAEPDNGGPQPPPMDIAQDADVRIVPAPDVFAQPARPPRQPVWLIVMGIYLVLGALGVVIATRRLRVTEPRSRGVPTAPAVTGAPPPATAAGPAPGTEPGSWEGAP
jgi:hypothetical protein